MLYISFDRVAHLFESSHTFSDRYKSIFVCTDIDNGICRMEYMLASYSYICVCYTFPYCMNISLLHLLHRYVEYLPAK